MKNILLLIIIALCLYSLNINAQLTVTNGYTAQQLGNILAGNNITVTNASVTGSNVQSGAFEFVGIGLNVNSGVILSTGDIFDAVGPNSSGSTSSSNNGPGEALLTSLAGYNTHDAVVLQFDFEVQTDMIEFKYIFLSEEYNEWVGSGFNDVFAFYISGPGIVGEENLAVVPGTTTPVSINTINSTSFWQFYVNNETGTTNIEFDGFTTLMTAKKEGLTPCETYTLKLMIADGSDFAYDSGVLLQENSLVQANVSATTNTFSANDIALEGCIQASFTFELDSAMQEDVNISIGIGGTAINGVDYAHIDSLIVIPAGQTEATIVIDSYGDGLTEGQETVELYFYPAPCQPADTVILYIDDYTLIEYETTPSDLTCNGDTTGEVILTVSGGIPPYYISLTDSVTNITQTYTTNPVVGLVASTYYVQVMDGYGCSAEDIVYGDIFGGGPVFIPDGTGLSYTTSINISGFGATQTLSNVNQIQSICMNMEHSRIGELEIKLLAPGGYEVVLKQQPGGAVTNMGEPCAIGPADAGNNDTSPGIGYDYCFTPNPTFGTMANEANNYSYSYTTICYGSIESDKYLPPGSYTSSQPLSDLVGAPLNGDWTLVITDEIPNNNGWIFDWSISLSADQPDSVFSILQPDLPVITTSTTQPDCGATNGAIDITVNGNAGPYTYYWSTGATTEDLSGLASGTYSLTITGTDACEYPYSFNLSNNGTLALSGNTSNSTCSGSNNGSIDLTVSGGTSPFTYIWSNSSVLEDLSNLSPGNYTVTVNDNGGCLGIETFTVTQIPPIYASAAITDENCGDNEGIINLTVTGGTSPYTFIWSNSQTTEDIDELGQGSYIVTITDINSCTLTNNYTIVNYVGNCIPNCDLEITSSITADETCGNGNGLIDLTIFTSFSPYSVQWSNGSTIEDLYALSSGNYTITITDEEGCEATQSFVISNLTGNLAITNTSTSNEICGNGTGSVDITVTGGALPYYYNWSTGATTQDLTNVNAGQYFVTVTDANNCSVYTSGIVTNISGTLTQTYGNAVNEVCSNHQGSIDIIISGGALPYSYIWSNGATSQDLIGIGAGSYTCTITDNNSCSIITPTYNVLNESGTLTINNIDVDNEICGNGLGNIEILVSGATPFTFLWSNSATTQDIFNLSAGTYSCQITDNNGCSTNTGNLNVINVPGTLNLVSAVKTDEICSNSQGSINLTISGGTIPYTYLWNTGATSEDLLNISAGNYSCTITDLNGCELTINKTILNNQGTLALLNSVVSNETCGNANGQINNIISGGNPPLNYLWSSGQTTEDISGLIAGSYSCTITDINGCQLFSNSTVVNNTGTLAITNEVITNEVCSDSQGAINLTVTGTQTPISFNWNSGQTTEDLNAIQAGTYTCTITDNSGCILLAGPYTINNSAPGLFINNVIVVDENCGDGLGSIDITVTGGSGSFTYLWSNSETTQDISNLSSGTYTVTVNDINGCAVSSSAIVDNNAGTLHLDSYLLTNEVCSNNAGAINITVSGGALPLSFNWSNTATIEDLTGLSAGIFNVTVTDNNGCAIISNNFTISNSSGSLTLNNVSVTDEVCGDATGSIDITISGGLVPITYNWSTGAITPDIINLSSGLYSCTVTDNNGCQLIFSENVFNDPGNLTVTNTTVTDETCNDDNGTVDITLFGGTSPYTFNWSNGAITEDITNVGAGNYTVVITDINGCTITHNASVINIGGTLLINPNNIIDEYCNNNNGIIDITITGGTAPYIYIWSSGQTTQDINSLNEGSYSCTVTDNIGCSSQSSFTIGNDLGSLSIDDVAITDEYCGDNEGIVDITYSGGTEPIVISWSNGSFDEDLEYLSYGIYIVTIVDAYGCNVTDTAIVQNETNGFVITNSTVSDENCGDGLGSIDLALTGGTTPYSYNWSNGESTEDLLNISEGTYSCSITDNTGCTITITEQIVNITNGLALTSSSTSNDYCYSGSGSIDQTITGGVTPYTFNWSNGSTSEDLNNIVGGTYDVTITDNTGCNIYSQYQVVSDINSNLGFGSITVINDTCGLGIGMIDFSLASSGNYIYEIDGVATGSTATQFDDLTEGMYVISIVDLGCRVDQVVNVGNETTFTANIINIIDENCGNGEGAASIDVVPNSGTYSFSWSNNTFSPNLINVNAGTYTCEITDAAGCHDMISVDIINNASFIASANIVNETCGMADGSIDIIATGTTGTVSYNWNTGATTVDLSGLAAGLYSCTITDDNCTVVINEEIFNNTGLFDVTGTVGDDFCNEGQGFVSIDIIGGSGTYDILWDNSSTIDSIYSLIEGDYSVTVTDLLNGCIYTDVYTVSNIAYFTTNGIVTNSSCQTCADGNINITITGGSPSYSYLWDNGATTQDISGILPGTYTVTITDFWGCIVVETYTVGYLYNQFTLSSNIQDDYCNSNDGYIEIIVSNGSGNYSFQWSNSQTSQNIVYLNAGNYTVTVTDISTSYTIIETYTVNNIGSYTLNTSTTNASCQTCVDGAINLTVSGSSGYTFNWSNGATSEDITDLLPGIYTVTISDIGGCEMIETLEIIYPTSQFSITETLENDSCNNAQGYIEIVVSGGSGDYSYNWITGATTADIYGLSAGTYSVTISDNISGYSQIETYTITNIGGYTVSSILTSAFCPTCNDGAINLTLFGSTGYTFNWSNGATTEDISTILPGSYTVTITDIASCEMVETYIVGYQPNQLYTSATIDNDSCNLAVGYIQLLVGGGSGNYSFNWSNAQTSQDITNLVMETYDVTITDITTGYTLVESYFIDNIGGFTVSGYVYNSTCATCNDGLITQNMTGSSGYTFIWSNGATTEGIGNLLPGIYSVTITDINGCEMFETYILGYPQYQLAVSSNYGNDSCNTSVAYIDINVSGGTGDYSYNWSNGATTEDLLNLVAGTYNVTITDNNTLYTLTESFIITNLGSYYISSSVTDASCGTCGDGSINLTLSGSSGYTFNWSNGATSEDLSNLMPGNYTVSITDINGCESIETYTISYPLSLLTMTETIGNDSCNNTLGFIELTVTGGSGNYSYSWSNGAISQNIYSLTAGTYDVTVTDNMTGYSIVDSYLIINLGTFTLSEVVTDATCGTCNDGSIDITLAGSSGYTFVWSNTETTEDISTLLPGSYTVTVTDIIGCEMLESYLVAYPSSQFYATGSIIPDTCSNSHGAVYLDIYGGSGDYSYIWSNAVTTQNNTNLLFGNYSVTVTDNITGYTYTDTYVVNFVGGFTVNSFISDATCSTCADGSIDITVNGSGIYTFNWSTGDTGEDLLNVLPGTYWLTITDDMGCNYIGSFVVDFGVSIADAEDVFSITVYPNPNKGEFTIKLTDSKTEDISIEIIDIRGQLIERRELNNVNTLEEQFDMKSEAKGLYYLRVISGSNIKIEKVMVQ